MMKLVLNRFRTVRGAVVGRLSQEIADRKGGILIGEAHAPGFVLRSQELFLQLFDRVKKVIARKGEVVVEVKEDMG